MANKYRMMLLEQPFLACRRKRAAVQREKKRLSAGSVGMDRWNSRLPLAAGSAPPSSVGISVARWRRGYGPAKRFRWLPSMRMHRSLGDSPDKCHNAGITLSNRVQPRRAMVAGIRLHAAAFVTRLFPASPGLRAGFRLRGRFEPRRMPRGVTALAQTRKG